jgi:hypothetical protein
MCRQLAPALKALLGCMDVWCDSRSEESSQSFVLWAGSVLSRRCLFLSIAWSRLALQLCGKAEVSFCHAKKIVRSRCAAAGYVLIGPVLLQSGI